MPKLSKGRVDSSKPKAKPYEIRGEHGLVLRIQPSGKKTFYAQFARGKRMRIGDAERVTLKRAEYRAREILNEAADEGSPLHREPTKSTLGGYIGSHYEPWLKANRRRADKTLLDLKRCFASLSDKRLTDITSADLDRYVTARRDEGRSAATIVRDLNNLRSVLRRAIADNYLRQSPFKGWEKPKVDDNGVTRYLSPEEEKHLRAALRKRDDAARRGRVRGNKWRASREYEPLPEIGTYSDHLTPMVLVSLNTGLRYGELTQLEWPAIDLGARKLTVTGRTAKGAKTRHIPLNVEAFEVLKKWREQGTGKGLVFANPDGSRIGSVKTAWLRVLDDAEISGFRWHDLRHSFASKLVKREVNLAVVRDLLGHGDFSLTLRYAHLDDKQKSDAVARLA
jgi:site-specific recombinase XerD